MPRRASSDHGVRTRRWLATAGLVAALSWVSAARATPAAPGNDAPAEQHLLGDWGGWRTDLKDRGLDLSLDLTSQVSANASGGKSAGADYAQQLRLSADVDWGKLAALKGLSTHLVLVNRAGRNLSTDHVGDPLFQSQSVYGGGGGALIHLVQVYGEQKLADGRVDIAAGRLPVGEDFATSPLYCEFLNTAVCGYPHSLPAKVGFSAFPNSTWGARLRLAGPPHLYVQTGAYEVRPRYGGPSGFDWGWSGTTGGYFPLEVGYEPLLGAQAMPGHYKAGVAYDTSAYPDLFQDAGHRPFALTGAPARSHRGRGSAYILADQMIARDGPGPTDGLVLLGGYVRSDPDTSQFAQFAFLGALAPSPLPSRHADSIGGMIAWAKIGDPLSRTQAIQATQGLPLEVGAVGVQSAETVLEARYDIALDKGLSVMPDLQYVIHPGAATTYPDATVVSLQLKASF